MKDRLINLGFSEKEAAVYLALLEFGNQPASVIAKKTGYPKSTVLFLFEELLEKGYIRKSRRGRTQYFSADPNDLEKAKVQELVATQNNLQSVLPLLREFKTPYSSEPQVTFFEGINGCRKAYSLLLESETEILEFGVHGDLEAKLGKDFMNDFIKQRMNKGLQLRAIAKQDEIHEKLCQFNKEHLRDIKFYPDKLGTLYSSIAIFEDKVLILNLFKDAFGILIKNYEVAQTLKTVFAMGWEDQ